MSCPLKLTELLRLCCQSRDGPLYPRLSNSLIMHIRARAPNTIVTSLYFTPCPASYSTRNTLDCDQSIYSSGIVFSHIPIEFWPTRNSAIRSADLKNPALEPNMKWIGWPLVEISPFEIFPNERSIVGQSIVNIYFLHWSHILLFATLGT